MRLGKFTGKIYDEDYDFSQCPECCLCLSEEQARDEKFLAEKRMQNMISCIGCKGCQASKNYLS